MPKRKKRKFQVLTRSTFILTCGNINWYHHFGKLWHYLLKLNTGPTYGSAIQLVAIHTPSRNVSISAPEGMYTSVHRSKISNHPKQNSPSAHQH